MVGIMEKGLKLSLAAFIAFVLAITVAPSNVATAQDDSQPVFANPFVEVLMGGRVQTPTSPRACRSQGVWSKAAKSAKDKETPPSDSDAAQTSGEASETTNADKAGKTSGKARTDSTGSPKSKQSEQKTAAALCTNLLTQASEAAGKGDHAAALEFYHLALKSASSSGDSKLGAPALAGAARMLHQLGRHKEALDHLNRSISINLANRNARARSLDYLLAGRIHLAQSDWDSALKFFEETQKILPASESAETPRLLEDIATCQLRLKRPADAVSTLNRLLGMHAKHGNNLEAARVNVLVGEVYVSRSDYTGARASFKKAENLYRDLNRNTEVGETLFRIAYLDQMLGDLSSAAKTLEEGQALLGNEGGGARNALPLFVRGLADQKDGKTIQALNHLTAALTAYESAGDPMMAARVRLALATVELERARFTSGLESGGKALEQFRALSSVGGEAAALYLIADVYYRQGFVQKAIAYAQDSLAAARRANDRNQTALGRGTVG